MQAIDGYSMRVAMLCGLYDLKLINDKEYTKQKEELLDEKKTLELTIKDENSIKERLKQFKKILENKEIIEEFNRTVQD